MEKEERGEMTELSPEEMLRVRFEAVFPALGEEELAAGLEELRREQSTAELMELAADPLLAEFAKERSGDVASVCEAYKAFRAVLEARLEEKLRRRNSRATSAGSAGNAGSRAGLSDAQCALLADWNRQHPEYKMSAREYAAALKA